MTSQGDPPDTWPKHKRRLGFILMGASIAAMVLLAVLSSQDQPASGSTSALIVVISSALQISGGLCFAKDHPAPLPHPRPQLRRLARHYTRLEAAEALAERAFESAASLSAMRTEMGKLSAQLSYAVEDASDIGEDWREMFPNEQEITSGEEEVPSEQD